MAIKPDHWIRHMAEQHAMIDPFTSEQVSGGVISYGLSSYGYDLRVADEFKIFSPPPGVTISPKSIPPEFYKDHRGAHCDIPPHGNILGRTVEYLRIPRDILTLCVGKSTYARSGVLINVTPFEPEWEGYVTVSIANTTAATVRIFSNEGLCQVLFFQADESCEVSYKERKGKYQAQKKIEFGRTL
jgi:dCTP deaminase